MLRLLRSVDDGVLHPSPPLRGRLPNSKSYLFRPECTILYPSIVMRLRSGGCRSCFRCLYEVYSSLSHVKSTAVACEVKGPQRNCLVIAPSGIGRTRSISVAVQVNICVLLSMWLPLTTHRRSHPSHFVSPFFCPPRTGKSTVAVAVAPKQIKYGFITVRSERWKTLRAMMLLDIAYLDADLRYVRTHRGPHDPMTHQTCPPSLAHGSAFHRPSALRPAGLPLVAASNLVCQSCAVSFAILHCLPPFPLLPLPVPRTFCRVRDRLVVRACLNRIMRGQTARQNFFVFARV